MSERASGRMLSQLLPCYSSLTVALVTAELVVNTAAILAGGQYLRSSVETEHDAVLPNAKQQDGEVRNLFEAAGNLPVMFYITMPLISAAVGWFTNWLALKLTFYPLRFRGIELVRFENQPLGLFGWQGIVPTKVRKMASDSVDLMTKKLFNIKEIFSRIEKDRAAEELKKGFDITLDHMIYEISDKYIIDKNTSWKSTEGAIKSQIKHWAMEELPAFTGGFMGDLVDNLDDVYDLKHMCVTEMEHNPELLVDVFLSVGRDELKFIERSGAYFGFLFGAIQASLNYLVIPPDIADIMLPVIGAIVGFATNYIALWMIFNPIKPIKVMGGKFTIQGLFLKRQQEASGIFASKMVGSVLHSERIWWYMMNGPKSDKFEDLLRKHTDDFTERMVGYTKPLVLTYMGTENFNRMRYDIQDMAVAEIENIVQYMHDYTNTALDLENEIRTKMSSLPSKEFEQVLHPVFEEDESKLIAVGAVLGAGAGAIQLLISTML